LGSIIRKSRLDHLAAVIHLGDDSVGAVRTIR